MQAVTYLRKLREIEARSGSATFSFTLATLIGHDELIRYTAQRAVQMYDLEVASFHVAQEWKERLVSSNRVVAQNLANSHSLRRLCGGR